MLQWDALKRLAPLGIFWAAYTLLFLLWKLTFLYSLPFLIGLLIAIAVQPIICFAENKLSLSHRVAAGAVTVLALVLLIAVLILLSVYAVGEITSFLVRATQGGFPEFSPPVRSFFEKISALFQNMDQNFWERNLQQLTEFLKDRADWIAAALSGVLKILTSLPAMVTMVLVSALSAYFIARDFDKLKVTILGFLSSRGKTLVQSVVKRSNGTGHRYVLSYILIYFISFCEAFVILSMLGLPYPLLTAFITCVADVLPVLGPGIVFTPLAIYQLLTGAYARCFGLLIGWLVMTCVRQVLEPRLVASTVKVHPLAMMAAVYFSLTAGSLWVLLYTAGFFMVYSILKETGIFSPQNDRKSE